MSIVSLPLAGQVVDRFIALLLDHGIAPPADSGIESELLSVTELLKLPTNLSRNLHTGLRAQGAGMFDLAAKLLAVHTQPEFASFRPHLNLFGSPLPNASVTLISPAADTDDVHRKLTELYLGTLAIHIGTNVRLDYPENSRGDNPDVLFDVTPVGDTTKSWAMAIKTISTQSGQTLYQNIEKASRQINAESCTAERGIVVINVQGSLNHQSLWSQRFPTKDHAISAVKDQILTLTAKANHDRPASDWQEALSGKTSPVVLYLAHTVVELRASDGSAVPTILRILLTDSPLGCTDIAAESIACGLNHYMQIIEEGIPGTASQQPR
jgi:hypothetical protein